MLVLGEEPPKTQQSDGPTLLDDDGAGVFLTSEDSFFDTVIPMRNAFGNPNISSDGSGRGVAYDHFDRDVDELTASGDLAFGTCICDGTVDLYEIRISLNAAGLAPDRPFFLSVNLLDDVDGGEVDYYRHWPTGNNRAVLELPM